MSVAALLLPVAEVVVRLTDRTPKDEDVKAGWTAFVIFLLLIAAVVVLAFSLVKQLRKAQAAKDAGVYGDEPDESAQSAEPSESEPR
jgi:uncharacterized membrane protein